MHHEIGGWLWLAITVVMVLVLAGAMVYGTVMWKKWKRYPTEVRERNRATREAFRQDSPPGSVP